MLKAVVFLAFCLALHALIIPATDSRIYYTEHNWYADPSGFLETLNPGAYIKLGFTGSSISLSLDEPFDQIICTLLWSVDDGSEQIRSPFDIGSSTFITIASDLNTSSPHSLFLIIRSQFSDDRWVNSSTRLRITSFTINDDATLFAPKLAPKRLLVYGDSIGEGYAVHGNLPWEYAHDAHKAFAFALAAGLNAELSLIAFGGQGYTTSGAGLCPPLWNSSGLSNESAWDWLSANHTRSFKKCPDYIINEHGTNDVESDSNMVFINALGWLKDMRKKCPDSQIFLTVPFGQFLEETLVKVFRAYQTESSDASAYLIQMGEQASVGLRNEGPSFASSDGLHPWAWKSVQLGARLAAKISAIVNEKHSWEFYFLMSAFYCRPVCQFI